MNLDGLRFFDPYGEILQTQNYLPHWQQVGATHFVTFRLADSIPKKIASEMGRTTRYLGQATPSTLDTGSKKYENLIAENVN